MKTIIVVRQDHEWSYRYAPSYFYANKFNAELVIKTWNSLFNIPYHKFRIALHEIQKINLADVGADFIVYENNLHNVLSDNDSLIIPTDDDDWFDPNICHVLKSTQFGRFIRWHYLRYFSSASVKLFKNPLPFYKNNNYAFRTLADWDLFGNMLQANDNIPQLEATFVEQALSVHNVNLSSLSVYYGYQAKGLEEHMLELYHYFNYDKSSLPNCFHKYTFLMVDLWKQLKLQNLGQHKML